MKRPNKNLLLIICSLILILLATSCSKSDKNKDDGKNISDNLNDNIQDENQKDQDLLVDNTKDKDQQDIDQKDKIKTFDDMIKTVQLKAKDPVTYEFSNVSVHDPSIIKEENTYYIFGSHLAAAKSDDLMNWTMIGSGVNPSNPIIPNAKIEMEEAFTWAKTNTFWAPDVVKLKDNKFYHYYCNCEGSSPLSALGYAVSDNIEGPYKDLGILLKSGMTDIASENGDKYNANIHPNAIDPHVFFDKEDRLWMLYGSYSGGIYILELDSETGRPLETGYGTKLLGENHLRIEGGYIQYSPETDYYYLFLSFGGLDRVGGYNIRVARSKTPDGPYYDYEGNNMIDCKGPSGSFFDDRAAEKYGNKLMGSYRWNSLEGEENSNRQAYLSPGHNSTIYQEDSGKYFIIFHTRFENRGETHEVRVHQMFLNEDGWFVVAPYRYTKETIASYTKEDVVGPYKTINHQKDISADIKESVNIALLDDNSIVGDMNGSWELTGDNFLTLTIDGTEYKGLVLEQWDEHGLKNVMTFSLMSDKGVSIWGSGYKAR